MEKKLSNIKQNIGYLYDNWAGLRLRLDYFMLVKSGNTDSISQQCLRGQRFQHFSPAQQQLLQVMNLRTREKVISEKSCWSVCLVKWKPVCIPVDSNERQLVHAGSSTFCCTLCFSLCFCNRCLRVTCHPSASATTSLLHHFKSLHPQGVWTERTDMLIEMPNFTPWAINTAAFFDRSLCEDIPDEIFLQSHPDLS